MVEEGTKIPADALVIGWQIQQSLLHIRDSIPSIKA